MNSNGNVAWEHTNVRAGGQLLATYDPNGIHFYLSDWTGSRRVQTNYEGVVEQTCTNLPYGNGESCSATPTEELYAGLERDSESGLDHAMFRSYASAFGRWLTPDPYDGSYDLTNPQSLNRYAYVGGSPFSGVDPSGLDDSGCFMPSYSTTPVCALSFGSKAASAVLQSTSLDGLLTSLGTVGNFLDGTPIGTLTTGVELVYDFGQAFGWWGGGSSFHGNAAASQSGKNVPSFASSVGNSPQADPDAVRIQQFSAAPNNGEPPSTCLAANIAAVNAVSNLNVNMNNVVGQPFMYNGGLDVNFSVPGGSPSQLPAGRYPSSFLNSLFGIGSSLHVPGAGGADPSTYGMSNGNFTFTTHIDSAYSTWHTPLGALIHYFVDVRGKGAHRGPC